MDVAAISAWLEELLPHDARAWVRAEAAALRAGAPGRRFFLALSAAPRHGGRAPLACPPGAAERLRPGWRPEHWTVEQAARTVLALAAGRGPVEKAFRAADEGELVALYQALPVLPEPEAWVERCAEGVRTNMTSVFRAVAHANPYPAERLPEDAWNQMVLKALFVGVPLDPIAGLDGRATPALMRMLVDYAHERWAAHRPVSPELWRCVGPHADDAAVRDLARVLAKGSAPERSAAALALRACPRPEADAVLAAHAGDLPDDPTWSDLA